MSTEVASSGSGAGEKLTQAMGALGSAAAGTALLAANTLDKAVEVANKTVEVTGETATHAVETAGIVAKVALDVTGKAAEAAGQISETALDTTVTVVDSAGRITSTTATTAANVVNSAGRITSTTTKAAANLTNTAARYTTKTANIAANIAIKAQEDAQKIASSAGDLAATVAANASKLGQSGSKATQEIGSAALEATSETTVKGLDLVKTTLATSVDLTKDLANNTIKGINNMVNIISSAGARYAQKVVIQQNAAKKTQEALGLTTAIKTQLRTELRAFAGEFTNSLTAFKATQIESLTVLQAILRNEYCLGKMSGLTRMFTKRCPPKANSESVSKQFKIYIDQNETRSKNIMLKVNSLIKAFEVNHINLINFTQSDPNEMIKNFKIRMDELMTTLANFTKEIQQIYQKTIDWVQSMIDKRMNSILSAYNTQPANNKGSVSSSENPIPINNMGNKPDNSGNTTPQPMIAMGGKRRTYRSRVAKKRKHHTIRRRRN